ncbi:MAG: EAL domain-containing protein [Halanaerobiaceae bacterium]
MLKLHNSLRIKITFFVLLVYIIITVVLISLSANLSDNFLTTLLHEHGEKTVNSYSGMVSNWFEEREADLDVYAETAEIKDMDYETIEPYLQGELEKHQHIYSMFFIADQAGNFRSTDGSSGNLANRSYFSEVMSGNLVISEPLVSLTDGEDIIVVAAPISIEGETQGLIGATIKLEVLTDFINKFTFDYQDSFSYLIDRKANLISWIPEREKIPFLSSVESQENWIDGFTEGGNLAKTGNIDYKNYFLYYHQLSELPDWYFVAQVSDDFLVNYINQASSRLIIIGIIGVILATIFSVVVSRTIANPIINLKEVFDKATSGDLSARTEINRNDEIGQAAESFNKMMDSLNQATYYDLHTGLPNRISLDNALNLLSDHARVNKEKFAVITLHINQYQNIVDTMGHRVGDQLLLLISSKLEQLPDEIKCFYWSEAEFVILLSESQKIKDIFEYIRKIFSTVNRTWEVDGVHYHVDSRMGIALYPDNGGNKDSLLKNSRLALHKAISDKQSDYQFFNQEMDDTLKENFLLDNYLRKALIAKEFTLHYQAQYSLADNSIKGMEALIRWHHPELGIISPGKFIPLAVENGLISEIGKWVLNKACQQHAAWQKAGLNPGKMAVNIATDQLMEDGFLDIVKEILEKNKMEPTLLELEITERAVVESASSTIDIINSLRELGIRVAVDDFGTGYSSLRYLKDFSVNNLKIDMTFIRQLFEKEGNKEIVRAIIAMAHSMNLEVTAEGVETKNHLDFLIKNNCDYAQGYYFARPYKAEEVELLLK